MSVTQSLLVIVLLILLSAFFSIAEIALAASRRLRLRQMADDGDGRAERALRVQEQPGEYFTVVQVGQNAVAILGGIVGEGAFSPALSVMFANWVSPSLAGTLGFLLSFFLVTSAFILLADLLPRRLSMNEPEHYIVRVLAPMRWCVTVFKPITWFYNQATEALFKLLGLVTMLGATMLVTTERGASVLLRQRTRLYYIVAWIGRWSMVDIFMESLLGALVQFGRVVTIEPGTGALAFCAVVFVTIFAAEAFDPRLMWDAAARNPHRPMALRQPIRSKRAIA